MGKLTSRFVALCIGVVAACALSFTGQPAAADTPKVLATMAVDETFVEQRMQWLGRPQPGFVIRWKTIRLNDEIGICGAVTFPEPQARSASRGVLRRAFITYQDQKIMRNMTYFARVRTEAALDTAVANCASTGVAAPRTWSVRLGWDAGRARL